MKDKEKTDIRKTVRHCLTKLTVYKLQLESVSIFAVVWRAKTAAKPSLKMILQPSCAITPLPWSLRKSRIHTKYGRR